MSKKVFIIKGDLVYNQNKELVFIHNPNGALTVNRDTLVPIKHRPWLIQKLNSWLWDWKDELSRCALILLMFGLAIPVFIGLIDGDRGEVLLDFRIVLGYADLVFFAMYCATKLIKEPKDELAYC
jgi:hypothetical protein